MISQAAPLVVAALVAFCWVLNSRAAEMFTVHYPPSQQPGELAVEATYHLWIPPAAKRVRAVIVHQHGCGEGAENSGETAALDLHWRALAARHDCALLSPHYRALNGNCRLWCEPRNGSGLVFQRALADLAKESGHAEIATAPWCLWGHSGGGFWASLMLEKHPERIVAVFCRSGTAMMALGKPERGPLNYPKAALGVPVVLNPGIKERGDSQFNFAWTGSLQFFEHFRSKGAPVAFAPDPFSSHDCRNSRLLAIPFFDACLRQRLPRRGAMLRPVNQASGFVGDWTTARVGPAGTNTSELSWLPDEISARAYTEYVATGVTTDRTPPAKAPRIIAVTRSPAEAGVVLEWTAEADFESGVRQFAIYRDGALLTHLPEKPDVRTGFAQFQTISYHDTPVPGAPLLRFIDRSAPTDARPSYAVATINGGGMEGPRSKAVKPASVR
jgi:pimeloyl-ACP methyl ester carboxylesterase